MGLFFQDAGANARKAPSAEQRRVIKLQAHQDKLNCAHCSLDRERLVTAKMPPSGADKPVLYFIGDAPSRHDDQGGGQFMGAGGSLLRDCIPEEWLPLIRWNNTIRCTPPANREPSGLEISCCRHLQVSDIEQTKPQAIVGFGGGPLEWLLGNDRPIGQWRGTRVPVRIGRHTCWYYPIEHPREILIRAQDKKKGEAIDCAFQRDVGRVLFEVRVGLPQPYVEEPGDYRAGITCHMTYGQDGLARVEKELLFWRDRDHGHDIETNALRPYFKEFKILSLAIGTYEQVFAFGLQHREAQWTSREWGRLKELLLHYLLGTGCKWAHNARFEEEWWHALFGPRVLYDAVWGDTEAQAHAIDHRETKSLDERVQAHFGFRLKDQNSDIDKTRMAEVPLSIVLPYNGMDTKYTHPLSILQADELERRGLTSVYETLNVATPGLVMMQSRGLHRNLPVIKELDAKLDKQEAKLSTEIMRNEDVLRLTKAGGSFIPTSPPSVAAFFRDYLKLPHPGHARNGGAFHKSGGSGKDSKEGKYSVDESVLLEFKHPVAAQVLELRGIIKNHGYVTPLLEQEWVTAKIANLRDEKAIRALRKNGGKLVHGDGLVHTSMSQLITVTGRLAASDPNIQNYPRREFPEIRGVYDAPPGFVIAAFDFGQIEWRLGACLSGDRTMLLELFDPSADIHGEWTDSMGAKFVPKMVRDKRKKVRDSIKQFWTFANLYGNEPSGIAFDLSQEFGVRITTEDVQPFYERFWLKYPALKKYQEHLIANYWEKGWVENGIGQRRYEPMAKNEIINHPFQGTAGHLVVNAQSRITQEAVRLGLLPRVPVMNIHDDLTFYLPKQGLDDHIETIARHMCFPAFDFIKCPLTVECKLGQTWDKLEEVAVFRTTDFYEMKEAA